jgi:CDP-glucose 4,6-dehydratase
VAAARPEVVVHMAAQSLVRRSFHEPAETYAVNVMGTVNLLEAVRRASDGPRVVVNVTSDKCYENREWLWGYREDEPMGGSDPYSSSKGCAELVTTAFRRSFFSDPDGPRLASARAGNVIGAGDWAQDRLVPDIVRAGLAGQPVVVRNPASVRPWQHVQNPLSGYLLLAERLWEDPSLAGGWNFGPPDEDARTVGEVVRRLAERWPGLRHEEAGDGGPHESRLLRVDSAKARTVLGWRAPWALEETLDSIVDWHLRVRDGEDARDLTLAQLRRHAAATSASAGR